MKLSSVQYSIFHRLCKKNKVSVNNFKLKKDELLENIHLYRKKIVVLRSCLVEIRKKFIIKHLYPHRNPFLRIQKCKTTSQNKIRKNQKALFKKNNEKDNLKGLLSIHFKTIHKPVKTEEKFVETTQNVLIKQELFDSNDDIEEEQVLINEFNTSKSIVDSLLNKFKTTIKNDNGTSDHFKKIQISNIIHEDVDFTKPSDPNQLSTPIVKTWRENSAFVSENEQDLIKLRDNKSQNSIFRDDCLMKRKSQPPLMLQPERPMNMEKARTVAEKKALLCQNNICYRMVEQESKIFHQIQRKKDKNQINYGLLDSLVHQDVPIKKDPWRALTWLRTTEGNYIYKYIRVDDLQLKLNGSCGNHSEKFLPKQTSMPFSRRKRLFKKSAKCCRFGNLSEAFIESICYRKSIKNFILSQKNVLRKLVQKKTIDTLLLKISARPLSKKLDYINTIIQNNNKGYDDDDLFLGEYKNFNLPNVNIEFEVKLKKAPDPIVRKYLQTILPYKDISESWIDFALSSMRSNMKDKNLEPQSNRYQFAIPYENHKSSIIVREINRQKEDNDKMHMPDSKSDGYSSEDDMDWTFEKNADKSDIVEKEIIDVIKDLTNSTFINLNDDFFTKNDDIEKEATEKIFNQMNPHKNLQVTKQTKSKKML